MDVLEKLLSTDLNVTKPIYIKRLDANVTVTGMLDDELDSIKERATFYTGKGNKQEKHVDQNKARYILIAKGLIEPNLNSNEVLEKLGVKEGWEAVPKLFLPGEQELLENGIGECSGFTDGEVEIEEVKN